MAPKGIEDERVLSEIGILFVEGFETTGHTTSWTLFNIATVPGETLRNNCSTPRKGAASCVAAADVFPN